MSTIPFNAEAVLNEGAQDKKKFELNDKAKAAMAAGVAGVATGTGVKAAFDALNNETDEESYLEPEKQDIHTAYTTQTATSTESTESLSATEVNPDEVMLEEPVLETTIEQPVAEDPIPNAEDPVYHTFANNDVVEDVVYDGVMPVDNLYAQGDESDIEIDVNPVDLICGEPNYIDETIEAMDDFNYHPDDQYAWESEPFDDTDIQTDLMA